MNGRIDPERMPLPESVVHPLGELAFAVTKGVTLLESAACSFSASPACMLDRTRIVLLRTSHPGNIGAAARAMKTMGLTRLLLVDPVRFPAPEAEFRSAGGADVLAQAQVVATLDDAIDSCQLVVGSSARSRRVPWPLLDPRQLAERLSQLPAQTEIAILFGNEQHGLSNEELHRCHWHVQIPADAEYGVLNLAAAVQVISYELRMQWLQAGDIATVSNSWDVPLATSSEIEQLFLHLQKLLLELDFYDPDNPRQLLTRLRRLLLRSGLDRMEGNILRGILAAAMARIDH